MKALILLLLACSPIWAAGESGIEEAVLDRWAEVSQLQVSERTRAYIEEGDRILARYGELQSLEAGADSTQQGEITIEVAKLKLKLLGLLRTIEEQALLEMDRPQLLDLQARYQAELEELLRQRNALRADILQQGEGFLSEYRRKRSLQKFRQRDVVAKLCLQLAELYYEQTQDEYFDELDRQAEAFDQGLPAGMEPVRDFYDAVNKYQRIVDEFPYSEYMDDALYNLAYIRENSLDEVEREASRRLYEQLVRDFSQSSYAPEAWMRLGEYWFNRAAQGDFEESIATAVDCYGKVLEYTEYDAREKALYKLGWCYYRSGDNTQSVEYFSQAALHGAGPEAEASDLRDESVTYIAVNYADPDWEAASIGPLTGFVRDNPAVYEGYGLQLMETYGDIWFTQVQDFAKAVAAYDSLLVLYPDSDEAPFIQEKIIACYGPEGLNDPASAYVEKNELFDVYNPESDWAEGREADARLPELINQNLRQNVRIALNLAYDSRQREKFDEFVDLSRKYLKTFPEDTSSFNIHWNLAKVLETEIKDPEKAYDEYMTIAAGYPERNVRDAAYNAIVMSETLVAGEGEVETEVIGDQPEGVEYTTTSLSPREEQKLAALSGFVELFPADEAAAGYLMVAGKMYYNRSDFLAAAELFDRVIGEYPESAELEEAYALKLEGQFARREFTAAEETAKTIQDLGLSEETLSKARTRQAESVYAAAEGFRKGEDHLAAAREFKRVALEVPDAAFADASLFDAADEFKLAGEFQESADTYLYLADNYPASEFADKSLSLAAFLFMQELDQRLMAAQNFERLAMEYPESEFARSSILNASYSYEQEEEWVATIRMNQLYVDRYPDAEDANAILFANAGLYLKLDDIESANRIYADFAARFPGDPRTVQAFTERGNWFLENEREAEARTEYQNAVARNRDLVATGGEGNPFYASKALRQIVEWEFDEYRAMELHLPANLLESELASKRAFRDRLYDDLTELLGYGSLDIFRARYLMAEIHAEFARAYREQERLDYSSPEERVKEEIRIQNTAHELAQVALTSFISTTEQLEGGIEDLQEQLEDLRRRQDELAAFIAAADTSGGAPQDSLDRQLSLQKAFDELENTVHESQTWTTRSRERVPEIVFADMELYESRVMQILDVPSRQRDVFLRAKDLDINYLGGAALQATQGVIEAWNQGLQTIAQVGLARNWRPRVLARVQDVAHKVPDAYEQFIRANARDEEAARLAFDEIIARGEGYYDERDRDQVDYGNDLLDMTEFNQAYAMNSLKVHGSIADMLAANDFSGGIPASLADSMVFRAFRLRDRIQARIDTLTAGKEVYWQQFTESASYVFEDAHNTYEDAIYSLSLSGEDALLECEPVVSAYNPDGLEGRKLLYQLAKIDPEQFGDRFGLQETERSLLSGSDWLVAEEYQEGFSSISLDSSANWDPVALVARPRLSALLPEASVLWHGGSASALTAADTSVVALDAPLPEGAVVLDTLAAADSLAAPRLRVLSFAQAESAEADTAYFRHNFRLDGTPIGAEIKIAGDDTFYLFFNGEYIDEVRAPEGQVSELRSYNLSEFLQEGVNAIAVEVEDADGSGGGLVAELLLREMPQLTDELFEAQIQQEREAREVQRLTREKNRIHDKNRVD